MHNLQIELTPSCFSPSPPPFFSSLSSPPPFFFLPYAHPGSVRGCRSTYADFVRDAGTACCHLAPFPSTPPLMDMDFFSHSLDQPLCTTTAWPSHPWRRIQTTTLSHSQLLQMPTLSTHQGTNRCRVPQKVENLSERCTTKQLCGYVIFQHPHHPPRLRHLPRAPQAHHAGHSVPSHTHLG